MQEGKAPKRLGKAFFEHYSLCRFEQRAKTALGNTVLPVRVRCTRLYFNMRVAACCAKLLRKHSVVALYCYTACDQTFRPPFFHEVREHAGSELLGCQQKRPAKPCVPTGYCHSCPASRERRFMDFEIVNVEDFERARRRRAFAFRSRRASRLGEHTTTTRTGVLEWHFVNGCGGRSFVEGPTNIVEACVNEQFVQILCTLVRGACCVDPLFGACAFRW